MTTLDNGLVIDESLNALNYTSWANTMSVFGFSGDKTGATIHHWGADGQDIHTVARYLASRNDRNNSAHFVLQEDYVYCIVNSFDSAWHSGHPKGNATTIGIECRPEMTEGDLDTLASLVRFLETVYGSLEIYLHKNWVNTDCPGRYESRIEEVIAEINGAVIAPAPVDIPVDAPHHECCCHA